MVCMVFTAVSMPVSMPVSIQGPARPRSVQVCTYRSPNLDAFSGLFLLEREPTYEAHNIARRQGVAWRLLAFLLECESRMWPLCLKGPDPDPCHTHIHTPTHSTRAPQHIPSHPITNQHTAAPAIHFQANFGGWFLRKRYHPLDAPLTPSPPAPA